MLRGFSGAAGLQARSGSLSWHALGCCGSLLRCEMKDVGVEVEFTFSNEVGVSLQQFKVEGLDITAFGVLYYSII